MSDRGAKHAAVRCSACGQRLTSKDTSSCPLCGFVFDFSTSHAVGDDITPYAQSYSLGKRGFARMCEWLWYAKSQRIKHLALMKPSVASRRFAGTNLALMTIGLGLFEVGQVGWKWVKALPELEPSGSILPLGDGWLHAAAAPRPLPITRSGELPVDLWWSYPQMVLGVVLAMGFGLLLGWLAIVMLRKLARVAHGRQYDGEQRMACAIMYSTAWVTPIFLATMLLGMLPLSYIGTMADWSFVPSRRMFYVAAGVLAGFGACLWWIWLVRLGFAAPHKVRGRVAACLGIGSPIIAGIVGCAWYFGVKYLHLLLSGAMKLEF